MCRWHIIARSAILYTYTVPTILYTVIVTIRLHFELSSTDETKLSITVCRLDEYIYTTDRAKKFFLQIDMEERKDILQIHQFKLG